MNQGPCGVVAVFAVWAAWPVAGHGQTDPGKLEAGRSEAKRVSFAQGIVLDWRIPGLELDATVVLREGGLELFACSPRTREHESILRVEARPMDVFRAMGLIGLEPGHPPAYDNIRDEWTQAAGGPVFLTVAYDSPLGPCAVPVESWLESTETGGVVGPLSWIFAGSKTFESGKFGADVDGTVVSVVDFDTTLIGLGQTHSSDDALLWVKARTAAIPKLGTRCRLLIQGPPDCGVKVLVEADRLVIDAKPGNGKESAGSFRDVGSLLAAVGDCGSGTSRPRPGQRFFLTTGQSVTAARLRQVLEAFKAEKVESDFIVVSSDLLLTQSHEKQPTLKQPGEREVGERDSSPP